MSLPVHLPPRNSLTVIGLGNDLLSDDGLGIRTIRQLKARLALDDAVFQELSVGGLQLLDHVVGYERCIIVDAMTTGKEPAGTIYRFVQTPDAKLVPLSSSHQIDLGQVLALAKLLGAELPETLTVYGIEALDVTTFRDGCTAQVSEAIPRLVDLICRDLDESVAISGLRTGGWEIIHDSVTH